METKTEETEDLGYVNWWEFSPVKDLFICRTVPDKTKKESETGIIFSTQESTVADRPFKGVVVSAGPDSKYKVGEYLWWQTTSGFDLAMIRPTESDEKFILLHTDAILGKKVKDTRTIRTTRTTKT